MTRKPPVISSYGGRKDSRPQQQPDTEPAIRSEAAQEVAEQVTVPQPVREAAPQPSPSAKKQGRKQKEDEAGKAQAAGFKGAAPASARVSGVGSQPAEPVVAFPDRKERDRRRGRRPWLPWAVGGGLAAVIALVMIVVIFSPALALKKITVDGLNLASEDQVQAALAPLQGEPLTRITQAEVTRLVSSLPQVDSVSIEARPPSTLLVHIVERIPVAVLKNGDQYALIDQEGVTLGSVPDPAAAKLPLIDGAGMRPESDQRSQDIFSAITAVLAALPQEVRAQMASATAGSPDAVELRLVNGKRVIWGDASQMALKAKVLKTLIDNPPAPPAGQPAAPVQIYDVSSPQRPVTR